MNTFGKNFRVTTFGESHGVALGAIVDGCPAGLPLTVQDIQHDLTRRKPGQSRVSTPRNESDQAEILSGVFEDKTIGTPIAIIVRNKDQKSKDYEEMKNIFRPGHADQTWFNKYKHRDYRGGGRQSGRETLSRVIGGAIAKKLLSHICNTKIIASTVQIGNICAKKFDEKEIEKNIMRCGDPQAAQKMEELVIKTKKEHDSLGGKVEIRIISPPKMCGTPVFGKIEAELAKAMLSIGTTRTFQYGEGIRVASRLGSEQNPIHEGISGGITTGDDIILQVTIKPPPTIAQEQKMNTSNDEQIIYSVKGRHDPVIAPRFVPVAESMAAIVFADALLSPPDRIDQIFRK